VQYFSSLDFKEEVEKSLEQLFGSVEIYSRERFIRKRTEQYEKIAETKEFFEVLEYGVKFLVNLNDYLDSGLFLDHRETRQLVAGLARGKSVLNLFAYTCSFSLHAAMQGARLTKSVDLSNTYLAWGKENFLINQVSFAGNEFERADCLKFLEKERATYDLIVVDPPTLSRSKKMDQFFDIQQDYPEILSKALKRLNPGGTLFFSTNSRTFTFDKTLFPAWSIQDISKKTIPLDFHQQKIHYCWKIRQSF
jgi:23S rRNA (cytosine1962-C5)-methyltransferase